MHSPIDTIGIARLDHEPCQLGEGPIWNFSKEALYWIDINGCAVWRYCPAEASIRKVWTSKSRIGALTLHIDGGFVVCAGNGIYVTNRDFTKMRMAAEVPMGDTARFNDAIVDSKGRLFVGVLWRNENDGVLYRIERGSEPVPVLTGLGVSNGMAISSDHGTFYHADSNTRLVTAYDYDALSGALSNPRVFYQGRPEDGFPDGLTMDSEGALWLACWGSGQVLRIDPDGLVLERLRIPARCVTSVAFGGPDLKTLFVTTTPDADTNIARVEGAPGSDIGGHVYAIQTHVEGRMEFLAAI